MMEFLEVGDLDFLANGDFWDWSGAGLYLTFINKAGCWIGSEGIVVLMTRRQENMVQE
jgi:hypothetical protein